MAGIIEWDENGYPTPESLWRLRKALMAEDQTALEPEDCKQNIAAFYAALKENRYSDYCGPERIEVRGEVIDVWGYHTGGWSGNEDIIAVLKESWLWDWSLERYDRGGHYYFRPIEQVRLKKPAKEA